MPVSFRKNERNLWGRVIRRLMFDLHMSRKEVAVLVGVSEPTIRYALRHFCFALPLVGAPLRLTPRVCGFGR